MKNLKEFYIQNIIIILSFNSNFKTKLTETNNEGLIDFKSFMKYLKSYSDSMSSDEHKLSELLRMYDKDNNGYLDVDEFKNIMSSVNETISEQDLIDIFGHDGTQKITITGKRKSIFYYWFVRI